MNASGYWIAALIGVVDAVCGLVLGFCARTGVVSLDWIYCALAMLLPGCMVAMLFTILAVNVEERIERDRDVDYASSNQWGMHL